MSKCRNAAKVELGKGIASANGNRSAGMVDLSALTAYVDKRVLVITQDGRTIVGTLAGFDQTTNIILSSSTERIYSLDEPVDEQALGLFVVRGDNITLIGELDDEADKAIDLASIRAEPIPEIVH
ncbi:BQ2448_6792 [Microbotryum intermedium]|uniref:LSM2-LSM8 complex subunit LSM8 n=1 Tax=Microbotryum intermedium TaxID=269621 RepID=A0A238FKP2_9BASI|nr:BQ2448_6792 [Microbotryum intermedium]